MGVFNQVVRMGHEQVVYCYDPATKLKAIIAIHDTTMGPALGGTRFWNYESEDEALLDVLRLSRGMTYKAAAAGLPLGGGKSVIIGDPSQLKSEEFFRAFGRFVNSLQGRYITAEDVNIKVADMNHVAKETQYVTGITDGSGDPSPVTALGVYHGIRAAAKAKFGSDSLEGRTVAVQGAGAVGAFLCDYLAQDKAKLIVADISRAKVKAVQEKHSCKVVESDQIFGVEADIFAPCALGAIVNDDTINQFKFKIIAGGANNQLHNEDTHGKKLLEKGILYAPDYLINAGGLINVCHELKGYNQAAAKEDTGRIYDSLLEIFDVSKKENIPTHAAANKMVEKRLENAVKERGSRNLSLRYGNQDWIKR